MKRTLLATTAALTLLLGGCAAEPPAPTPARSAPSPATMTPAAPTPTPEATEAAVAAEVEIMKDVWESAPSGQQQWVRDQLAQLDDDEAARELIEQAAELGYTVTPEAADEFLAWLATQ